jgi:archaellum biogenesis ATPase FlaH
MDKLKRDEVLQTLKLLKAPGEVIEIRVLGQGKDKGFTLCGAFDSPELAVDGMIKANITKQVCFYFVMNEINKDVYQNKNKNVLKIASSAAKNSEIKSYKWIYIDIDPNNGIRKTGEASTKDELKLARQKQIEVYEFLKNKGWHEPINAFSANGFHLLYRVDFENTPDNATLVKRFLSVLSDKFSDNANTIDTSVNNPARICKLYGTLSQKGENTEERPYRFCQLLSVPSKIEVNSIDKLKEIAVDLTKDEIERETKNKTQENFDLDEFIKKYGIEVQERKNDGGKEIYVLDHCLFYPEHQSKDAAIIKCADGTLGYKCFHNHCVNYGWKDVRKLFEPDAYDKPAKQKEQKKEVNLEDVKLFYDYNEINLFYGMKDRCLTGIHELDKLTKGFTYNSVTLWAAQTNAGKTTLLSMLATSFIQQGRKVLYFAGEQTKEDFKNDFQLQLTPKEHIIRQQYQNEEIYDYYVDEQARSIVDNKLGGNLFIYNNEAPRTIEVLLAAMKKAHDEYFVRDFVIDNLMQIDNENVDLYRGQEKIAESLRKFAIDEKCNIHLVAHSRKTNGNSIRLTMFDVAGTQNISNKAYNIITLTRTDQLDKTNPEYDKLQEDCAKSGYDLKELDAVLEVIKTKGKGTGLVGLKYEPITKTYVEIKRRHIEMPKPKSKKRPE